uniref:Putative secreted protein n=1 Tax=Anopheles triannulatus TaxID=58253 RepID=A0A2M4B4X5_9DIPT
MVLVHVWFFSIENTVMCLVIRDPFFTGTGFRSDREPSYRPFYEAFGNRKPHGSCLASESSMHRCFDESCSNTSEPGDIV